MSELITINNNYKISMFMGGQLMGAYFGAKAGYSDTRLVDMGTKECKASKGEYPENTRFWSDTQMKYHKSWDWLMPVVHRIGKLQFVEYPGLREHLEQYEYTVFLGSSIDVVYEKVVATIDFISK
jgi:hypothetical protein